MSLQQAYRGGCADRTGQGWWLHFDYDEVLIDRLKAAIRPALRAWDEEQKRWWISVEAENSLLGLIPALEAYMRQGNLL